MTTPAERLDDEERRLIAAVEARRPVLNIKLAKSSASYVPLDAVAPPGRVRVFLDGHSDPPNPRQWRDWPLLRTKQQRRFESFSRQSIYSSALQVLSTYVSRCILDPAATEVLFWSVTVLGGERGFRLNVGQQECLTLAFDGENWFARVLAPTRLGRDWEGPLYQSNSYVTYVSVTSFDRWLSPRRSRECRKLTVWLMRHTTPLNSGSHCPQLVRAALPDLTTP